MERNKTYFILSRAIFTSAIWLDNPHVLKLFIYLIGNARYKNEPKKYPNFQVNRGEVLTSLSDLSEANEYVEFGKVQKWSRAKVSRMLQKLEEQDYIKTISDTYGTHISICNYETYQNHVRYKSDSSETVPNTSENTLQTPCKQGEHNSKKEKKVNKDKLEIPEWIPKEAWYGFVEMRNKIKAPLTDRAIKLQITKLAELKEQGSDPEYVLNQSVVNGWKGLFPLKEGEQGKEVKRWADT